MIVVKLIRFIHYKSTREEFFFFFLCNPVVTPIIVKVKNFRFKPTIDEMRIKNFSIQATSKRILKKKKKLITWIEIELTISGLNRLVNWFFIMVWNITLL